jgi:hypothetical protein
LNVHNYHHYTGGIFFQAVEKLDYNVTPAPVFTGINSSRIPVGMNNTGFPLPWE